MYSLEKIKEILKDNKEDLFSKYPLKEIGIFGSYVSGKHNKKSDVDILIDYNAKQKFSLIDLIKFQDYLSQLLKVKVDVALKTKLKTEIGYHILREVVYI